MSARKATASKGTASKGTASKGTASKATAATQAEPAAAIGVVVDPAQLDLLARPVPSPEILAAITSAAQLVWPQPALPDAQDPVHDAWRFSGRWWAQPAAMRRARPWARR